MGDISVDLKDSHNAWCQEYLNWFLSICFNCQRVTKTQRNKLTYPRDGSDAKNPLRTTRYCGFVMEPYAPISRNMVCLPV